MGQSPFSRKDAFSLPGTARRRSTRLDYQTPVILSGRDATGQPFREETTTLIVNFHGAKIRTARPILVGMLVTVECLRTRVTAKAVCVNTYAPAPDDPLPAIAVQLVQPGNMWGVERPPADWATVAAALGSGPSVPESAARPPRAPSPAAPNLQPFSSPSRLALEAPVPEYEQRAARLMDSVLEALRVQAGSIVRDLLTSYDQRVAALAADGEGRIARRAEQAASDMAATVETLRTEAMGDLIQDALQGFHKRIGELAAEEEGRISQRAEMIFAQSEDRLEQMVARGTGQANAIAAALEQRLNATKPGPEGKPAPAGRAAAEADQAFEMLQKRAQNLAASLENRVIQHTSQAIADLDAALELFRKRLAEESDSAGHKVSERTDKAFAEFEAALVAFRSDLDDELAARGEQLLQEAEQAWQSQAAGRSSGAAQPQVPDSAPPVNAVAKK